MRGFFREMLDEFHRTEEAPDDILAAAAQMRANIHKLMDEPQDVEPLIVFLLVAVERLAERVDELEEGGRR